MVQTARKEKWTSHVRVDGVNVLAVNTQQTEERDSTYDHVAHVTLFPITCATWKSKSLFFFAFLLLYLFRLRGNRQLCCAPSSLILLSCSRIWFVLLVKWPKVFKQSFFMCLYVCDSRITKSDGSLLDFCLQKDSNQFPRNVRRPLAVMRLTTRSIPFIILRSTPSTVIFCLKKK